eukprot:416379-Alexandrium_andersonii.AAC.1
MGAHARTETHQRSSQVAQPRGLPVQLSCGAPRAFSARPRNIDEALAGGPWGLQEQEEFRRWN